MMSLAGASVWRHSTAADKDKTCIDCHYGIVHTLPEDAEDILDRINAEGSGE